ncbi:MAG TPA: cytochrome c [Acidobacteriaceae bacterium]|nr:cytochrome c [Acidobacteriaceae bacterium]
MLRKAALAVVVGVSYLVLAGGLAFAGCHPDVTVKSGKALFQRDCAGCHNKQPGDTSPFGPPNLHGVFEHKVLTPEEVRNIIRHGKGSMPPFGSLSDTQLDHLLAYLKAQ